MKNEKHPILTLVSRGVNTPYISNPASGRLVSVAPKKFRTRKKSMKSMNMKVTLVCCLTGLIIATTTTQSRAAAYPDAVNADGPIVYFRFSDTPPVAINSGSLGAAVNGTYNGTAAPGDQAPRSPDFFGFEPDNT